MKNLTSILVISCVMSLFACEQKKIDNSYKQESFSKGSMTLNVIRKHIRELGEERWDANNYHKIMDEMIDKTTASKNEKKGLRDTLNYVYKGVLVREVDTILSKECSKERHGVLNAAVKELKGFAVPGWNNDSTNVMREYGKHQDLLDFIAKELWKKQIPCSLSDKYDFSFEKKMRAKVNTILEEGVQCSYISNQLKNANNAFKSRRRHYCNELVNLYCRQTNYQAKEETRLKSELISVNNSIDEEWTKKINEFRRKYETLK